MLKYLHLFLGFLKASLIADLEFRTNITIKVIGDCLWYVAQISLFEVLFSHSNQLLDWTKPSMRVFMAVLFIVDALWMWLFSENVDRLSEKIRKGDLDLLLTKPVNSLFMLSFRKLNSAYVVNLVLVTGWLVLSLIQLPEAPGLWRILSLIIFIPCGLALIFCMRLFFASQAIFFTNVDNINYVWYQLYRLGTRPHNLYPSWVRYLVLFFFPVGFLASVPSRVVLGLEDGSRVVLAIALTAVFVTAARIYWRYAISHYTSASS